MTGERSAFLVTSISDWEALLYDKAIRHYVLKLMSG